LVYLDTNVVIAYIDESDSQHSKAVEIVEIFDKKEISKLVLTELASVLARAGYENYLTLTIYAAKAVKAIVLDVDFDEVYKYAIKLAGRVKLRTLDLLHITICLVNGIDEFATFDQEIIKRKDVLKELGVKVIDKTT